MRPRSDLSTLPLQLRRAMERMEELTDARWVDTPERSRRCLQAWHELRELAGDYYDLRDELGTSNPDYIPRTEIDELAFWRAQIRFWRTMPAGTETAAALEICIQGLNRVRGR